MSDSPKPPASVPYAQTRPGVGVGVFVRRRINDADAVLVGQRKGSHGAGTWHLPGGHLEMYETPLETALREVAEEAGISIENVRLTGIYTDDPMPQWHRHYITLYVVSDWKEGEPRILEPEKCAEWRWCRWNEIPRPLFPSLENVLKKGYSPFEWH